MFVNSAYLNDSLLNYKDTKNPISVSCCGNYRLISINELPTYRPKGRLDYQLIYIASGIAHFYFNNTDEETIIPAGTFVLFRPKEYQKYVYYGNDHQYHIYTAQGMPIYSVEDICSHLVQVYNEVATMRANFKSSHPLFNSEYELAKAYCSFLTDYYTGKGYDYNSPSPGETRFYKENPGKDFYDYLIYRRIQEAEKLLAEADLSITDVALYSGFSSISTFNRTFKQKKNCTPREYRAMCRNQFKKASEAQKNYTTSQSAK